MSSPGGRPGGRVSGQGPPRHLSLLLRVLRWVGPGNHAASRAPALCSPRADNWLVDTGEDKARSQGLSLFGQVSGARGLGHPQRTRRVTCFLICEMGQQDGSSTGTHRSLEWPPVFQPLKGLLTPGQCPSPHLDFPGGHQKPQKVV